MANLVNVNNVVIKAWYNIFFLIVMLGHYSDGIAQSKYLEQRDMYKLPAYTFVSDVSWRDSVYRFPTFQYGRITLATGFSPEEKIRLNYNLYMGQMQLITNDGDTSYVKRLKELRYISIGDHLFYHDYKIGYIEIIHKVPVALGVLNMMVTADSDVRSTTSRYDRYYVKKGYYYFFDKENKPSKASRASIQKLFPDQQKEIKAYLGENRIDFESSQDLIKLLTFCDELSKGDRN